jgi:hypothetical protein
MMSNRVVEDGLTRESYRDRKKPVMEEFERIIDFILVPLSCWTHAEPQPLA